MIKKKFLAFGIIALFVLGIAGATLLTYFGSITTSITVQQAVTISGTTVFTNSLAGSESYSTPSVNVVSHTASNDLDVGVSQECDPDCVGIDYTNLFQHNVSLFGSEDAFASAHYRKTYYKPSGTLGDINNITYKFKIASRTSGVGNNLFPYIVIGNDDWLAVQMIPDGATYETGVLYTKVVSDTTLFHIPVGSGSDVCTQSSPCTLSAIRSSYPSQAITKVIVATGAWGGSTSENMQIYAGITKINGAQAQVKTFKLLAGETVPLFSVYETKPALAGGTYTLTTNITAL